MNSSPTTAVQTMGIEMVSQPRSRAPRACLPLSLSYMMDEDGDRDGDGDGDGSVDGTAGIWNFRGRDWQGVQLGWTL